MGYWIKGRLLIQNEEVKRSKEKQHVINSGGDEAANRLM